MTSVSVRVLAFAVLVLSLTLMPSLVFGPYTRITISTDKSTYHVGESWTGVSWDKTKVQWYCMAGQASTGTLTITGPHNQTSFKLNSNQMVTGSFKPLRPPIGTPWKATDVGNWQAELNVVIPECNAAGSVGFQVVSA